MTALAHNPVLERVKTTLWGIMGVWAVVTFARFWSGLGATSNLTDVAPWGFWIAFDVMAGVALAAGGFVLAATVYIFGLKSFVPLVRPAILTALLGYIAVATGLLYDLGLPWNIWHPLVFPQHHSVLFEVAMCVMLYLTVLALEFSPVVLEHPVFSHRFFQAFLRGIRKLTVPIVIIGIVLSTLHQSSLGSLFLIQPYRVHPLWYSPSIPWLYFISAVGLGLMMVTLEALIGARLFGHRVPVTLLARLGVAASVVLALYALIRLADLWWRGILIKQLDGSWQAGLFLFEIVTSAALPALLLSIRRVRESIPGLMTCSIMVVMGIIGYRFNTCIVAFERPDAMPYFPSWIELAVSLGIVAGAALVFIFFNENLRIKVSDTHEHEHGAEPIVRSTLPPGTYARRHSLAFVLAAAAATGCLPRQAIFGPQPERIPVSPTRSLDALAIRTDSPRRLEFVVSSLSGEVPAAAESAPVRIMMIDGNRNWRFVPFRHEGHAEALGGRESCRVCHHQNLTFDQNTACYQCHRDMYETTDTFDHFLHIERLGGQGSCLPCHAPDYARKSRQTALDCWKCHGDMVVKGSRIPTVEGELVGYAPGYMDAMHGLCIGCHEQMAREEPERVGPEFGRCDVCHRAFQDVDHRRLAPYVVMPEAHVPARTRATSSAPADGGH